MSEWLKETGCKPVGSAYAGSNPAPPISGRIGEDRVVGPVYSLPVPLTGTSSELTSSPVAGSLAVIVIVPVAGQPAKNALGVKRTTARQLVPGPMGGSVSNTGQVDPGIRPKPKSSGSP